MMLSTYTKIINHSLKITAICLLSVFLANCTSKQPTPTSTPPPPKKDFYPKWFSETSKDSMVFYYGVGEAKTKNMARDIALNEIASKVSIKISSSANSQKVATSSSKRGQYYEQSMSQNIDNEVKKIEFNEYKITKSAILDNGMHVVQVRVNRHKLAEQIANKVNLKLNEYEQLTKSGNQNLFKKLKKYSKALIDLDNNLLPKYYTIKALSDSFDKISTRIQNLKSQIVKYKNTVVFRVFSIKKDKGYEAYADSVVKYITNNGYQTTNKIDPNNINFLIFYDEKNLKIGNSYIFKSRVVLTVKQKDNTLHKEQINLAAKSSSSQSSSKGFGLKKLDKKLKESGLF